MKLSQIWNAVVVLIIFTLSGCTLDMSQPATPAKQVELQLVNHLVAGFPEQDVYVHSENDRNLVRRIIAGEQGDFVDAPVYGTAVMVEHDPLQVHSDLMEPHPKGIDLGFTMEAWLSASAQGAYTVQENDAEIDLAFQNLVPNGVYTLWCSRFYPPPTYKFIDTACGDAAGADNTFIADADGNANFHLTMAALPDSTPEMVNVISAAYHSDGKTYDNLPGDFGLNSHIQIFTMLPGPDDVAWQTLDNVSIAKK